MHSNQIEAMNTCSHGLQWSSDPNPCVVMVVINMEYIWLCKECKENISNIYFSQNHIQTKCGEILSRRLIKVAYILCSMSCHNYICFNTRVFLNFICSLLAMVCRWMKKTSNIRYSLPPNHHLLNFDTYICFWRVTLLSYHHNKIYTVYNYNNDMYRDLTS